MSHPNMFSDSQHIPAWLSRSCQASCWHLFNETYKQDLCWTVFPAVCSLRAWCVLGPPLGPALIRPVNRMDGWPRPSLEPIRSTERQSVRRLLPHQSYCTWECQLKNTELHCTACLHALYITCNSPLLLLPCPSLSPFHVTLAPLPSRPSLPALCLHSVRSHVISLSWCRTLPSYVLWHGK